MVGIAVFILSYMICEMLEIKYDGGQTDFTLIAKTIQIIVATPINIYFGYLVIKFCIMSIYLQKTMNGLEKPDALAKAIFITIAVMLLLHFTFDSFMVYFPYITLYGYRQEYWRGYPKFQ